MRLLGCGLSGQSFNHDEVVYFTNEIENLAIRHQCLPMVYQGAVMNSIPVPEKWKIQTLFGALNNAKKMKVQKKILTILSEANISHAILKGSSISAVYENSDIRQLGDIDILVPEEDYERAIRLFVKDVEQNSHKFHYSFEFDGVMVEIHKHVTFTADDERGRIISDIMSGALDEINYCNYQKQSFPVLKNKFQAIALLLHKLRHIEKNNFVMRMLCDWAMFVKSVDETEWNTEVYPVIRQIGLDLFADALTSCADRFMNIPIGNRMGNKIDSDVINALMEVLVSCGIGIYEGSLAPSISSLYAKHRQKHGVILSYIKTINELATGRFKLAKCKLFLPVFWLFIPAKYLFLAIVGKREKINFLIMNRSLNQRKVMYDILKLK